MIIRQLEIVGFGKWQDKVVVFDGNFQLIFGENEAGKSTMYQFIREILFGFPNKRQSVKDYTPKRNCLYGGRIWFHHPKCGEVMVERIKTTNRGKAHVYLSDGEIGGEDTLINLLAPLTLEIFDDVFSLQQEQLLEIKHLGEARLQNLLLTVGLSGSQRMLEAKDNFYQRQQELYKPNGRLPEINQKLVAYQELQQLVLKKEASEQNYRQQLQAAEVLEEQLKTSKEELREKEKELERLLKQQELYPVYEQRKQLVTVNNYRKEDQLEVEKMGKVAKAYETYLFLNNQEKHYQELKTAQLLASQDSPASLFYLAKEQEIQRLVQNQSTVESAVNRHQWLTDILVQREAEFQQLKSQVELAEQEENWTPDESIKAKLALLANQEKEVEERLHIEEVAFDQEMDRLEQKQVRSTGVVGKREGKQATPSVVGTYGLAFLIGLVGLVLFVLRQVPLGILVCLVGAVVAVLISWRQTNKKNTVAELPVLEEPNDRIEVLAKKLEQTQKKLVEITSQKSLLANKFCFNVMEPMASWLFELPLRERLVAVRKERETALLELTELKEALVKKRQDLGFMSEWLAVETDGLVPLYRKVVEFNQEMQERQQVVAEETQGVHRWREPLMDVRQRQANVIEEINQLLPQMTVANLDELPVLLASQEERNNQLLEIGHLTRQLEGVFDLEADYRLPEILAKIRQKEEIKQEELAAYDRRAQRLQEVTFTIRQQEEDGTLSKLYQERENSQSEIRQLTENWMTYRVSEKVMEDLLDLLATQQLPELLTVTTRYFNQLTLGKYLDCQMLEGKLVVLNQEDQIMKLSELSTGTRDQLYMAVRLAFIELHSQEQLAPVIIDDGWLHYDSERKSSFFELLAKMSQSVQIICFTSDKELFGFAVENNLQVEQLS